MLLSNWPSILYMSDYIQTKLRRSMNLERIFLEPHQQELLIALVEADKSLPADSRSEFFYVPTFGRSAVDHPGLPEGGRDVFMVTLKH